MGHDATGHPSTDRPELRNRWPSESVPGTGPGTSHGPLQGPELVAGQLPPCTGCKGPVCQRPDAGPDESHDRVAYGIAHPSHLPVPALVDGQPEHRWFQEGGPGRGRHPVIQLDALPESPQGGTCK